MSQTGLFDEQILLARQDKKGDPLARLNRAVNWQALLKVIEPALQAEERRSPAGRKPYAPVLMLKVLVLQSLYNMADERLERELEDKLSFRRFVGLSGSEKAPDATTIWRFRAPLA